MTPEQIEARYPRLIRSLMWVGILSRGEAVSVIRDRRYGYPYGGEAVMHFGQGHPDRNLYILQRAVACRNAARRNHNLPVPGSKRVA